MSSRHFVAEVKGKRIAIDLTESPGFQSVSALYESVARQAVERSGFTTAYSCPDDVKVRLFELTIERGELIETYLYTVTVPFPIAAMTLDEYTTVMIDKLARVPVAFHPVAQWMAENMREAGVEREAVLRNVDELISLLRNSIDLYRRTTA